MFNQHLRKRLFSAHGSAVSQTTLRRVLLSTNRSKLTNEGMPHNDGCTPARQLDCSRKSLASLIAPACSRWLFLATSPVPLREIQPPPAPVRSRRPISRAPAPLRGCRKIRHHHDRAIVDLRPKWPLFVVYARSAATQLKRSCFSSVSTYIFLLRSGNKCGVLYKRETQTTQKK